MPSNALKCKHLSVRPHANDRHWLEVECRSAGACQLPCRTASPSINQSSLLLATLLPPPLVCLPQQLAVPSSTLGVFKVVGICFTGCRV